MIAVWALFATVFGLAVGSFLNVVICRVPAGQSVVSPPSRCPYCGNGIRNRHNVPVLGWLVLHGRCYDCRAPISPRYPIVEGLTGVLFGETTMTLMNLHQDAALPAFLLLVAFGIVVVAVRIDKARLPSPRAFWPLLLAGVALVVPAALGVGGWPCAIVGIVLCAGLAYFVPSERRVTGGGERPADLGGARSNPAKPT